MSLLFIFDKRSHSAAEHEDDCHKMYPKLDTKRIMIKSFTMSNNMNHFAIEWTFVNVYIFMVYGLN